MKALRFHNARDLRLDEVSATSGTAGRPSGIEGPAMWNLRHRSSRVCRRAHHAARKTSSGERSQNPIILGHEFSATVSSVGPAVTTTKPGIASRFFRI